MAEPRREHRIWVRQVGKGGLVVELARAPQVSYRSREELKRQLQAAARHLWPTGKVMDVEVRGRWQDCTARIGVRHIGGHTTTYEVGPVPTRQVPQRSADMRS